MVVDVSDALRDVTSEDKEYLKNIRPYIEIENSPKTAKLKAKSGADFNKKDLGDPVELRTKLGWLLFYYPPSNGPARVRLAKTWGSEEESDTDVDASVEKQALWTAVELVELVMNQGWDKFKLVEGSSDLTIKVWGYLKYKKLSLSNYKPSKEDKERILHDDVAYSYDEALKALKGAKSEGKSPKQSR